MQLYEFILDNDKGVIKRNSYEVKETPQLYKCVTPRETFSTLYSSRISKKKVWEVNYHYGKLVYFSDNPDIELAVDNFEAFYREHVIQDAQKKIQNAQKSLRDAHNILERLQNYGK